jgi:DNA-damage-inducible protein J
MTTQTKPSVSKRPKTGYINARVAPALKHDAERVLTTLGVSTTEAITMFLRQVVLNQGLPFPVRIPNAVTVAAIKSAHEKRATLTDYDSVDALMADVWPEEMPKRK